MEDEIGRQTWLPLDGFKPTTMDYIQFHMNWLELSFKKINVAEVGREQWNGRLLGAHCIFWGRAKRAEVGWGQWECYKRLVYKGKA